MRILQVSTADTGGGAERVARSLFEVFRARGLESFLAVGQKQSVDPNILPISNSNDRKVGVQRYRQSQISDTSFPRRISERFNRFIRDPVGGVEHLLGLEDFRAPGTWRLLDLVPKGLPDVVHLHNLHGGSYFDLRALPWLSRAVPVILHLHDGWMLSGHCAHSFGCERWETGCGRCPDLTIYPAIRRDATAFNWRRKRGIYQGSRLFLIAPSRWLMDRALRSMLGLAVEDAAVIPNGIDLSIFQAREKDAARVRLGIPAGTQVILIVEGNPAKNRWKDVVTIRSAVSRIAATFPQKNVMFLVLGDPGECRVESPMAATVRWLGYLSDPAQVALCLQASDLYLHAAHADTHPLAVIESLACGTPVIATAVGGIPEQVKGLSVPGHPASLPSYEVAEATGVLVPAADADHMAAAATTLMKHDDVLQHLSRNAVRDAQARFDLSGQVDSVLEWYRRAIRAHKRTPRTGANRLMPPTQVD